MRVGPHRRLLASSTPQERHNGENQLGAAAYSAELAALLIGVGVGAIVQVIQLLIPSMRDNAGRALYPASIGGILAGGAALYVAGLLVSA